MTGYEKVTF